jgi:AcrR family transcriptional regulator
LELYKSQGIEQTSMDEIAERAGVSKVTIYKYFHCKEELSQQVISLYIDQTLEETEKKLAKGGDIIEKLQILKRVQANAPQLMDSQSLSSMLEQDGSTQLDMKGRIRDLMFRIYEEGKQEGI